MDINADIIKQAVLGVAIANKKSHTDEYKKYRTQLESQLGEEKIDKIEPFYKEGHPNQPAGYVIKTDSKILVSYHGTKNFLGMEGLHDMQTSRTGMKFGENTGLVHTGFKKEYELSKASLSLALDNIGADKPVVFSGHSLGGSVANIAALDFITNHPRELDIQAVVTFGSPRVFALKTAKLYNRLGLGDKTYRIKNDADIAPKFPDKIRYEHVGKKIKIKSGSMNIHGGSTYREISSKLTDLDVAKAKDSKSVNKRLYSIDDYIQMVMKGIEVAMLVVSSKLSNKIHKITQKYKKNKITKSKEYNDHEALLNNKKSPCIKR